MKQPHILALAVLTGLSGLGCATAPSGTVADAARPAAASGCRNVTSLTSGEIHSYCGTPEQWAEFDSRMAQLGQGFSCRPVRGSQPLCLFAKQWEYVNRMNARGAGAQSSFGDEAARSAMEINHDTYGAIRQGLIDSTNGLLPIP